MSGYRSEWTWKWTWMRNEWAGGRVFVCCGSLTSGQFLQALFSLSKAFMITSLSMFVAV